MCVKFSRVCIRVDESDVYLHDNLAASHANEFSIGVVIPVNSYQRSLKRHISHIFCELVSSAENN